jgi:hypothetical protein
MPSHIYPRGTTYIFRRIVPAELRHIIGRSEIKKSLCKDFREACRLGAVFTVETDEQFKTARLLLADLITAEQSLDAYISKPIDNRMKTIRTLPDGFSRALAEFWFCGLAIDLQRRLEGISNEEFEEMERSVAEIRPLINRALATGQLDGWYSSIATLCAGRGYFLDLPEPELRSLTFDMLKAYKDGYQIIAERQRGDLTTPQESNIQPLPAVWSPKKVTVQKATDVWKALFDNWMKERHREGNTVYEVRQYWSWLEDFATKRDLVPSTFARKYVTEFFREIRQERGSKAATLKKIGGLMGAVFSVANEDELLENNPWHRYKYQGNYIGCIIQVFKIQIWVANSSTN